MIAAFGASFQQRARAGPRRGVQQDDRVVVREVLVGEDARVLVRRCRSCSRRRRCSCSPPSRPCSRAASSAVWTTGRPSLMRVGVAEAGGAGVEQDALALRLRGGRGQRRCASSAASSRPAARRRAARARRTSSRSPSAKLLLRGSRSSPDRPVRIRARPDRLGYKLRLALRRLSSDFCASADRSLGRIRPPVALAEQDGERRDEQRAHEERVREQPERDDEADLEQRLQRQRHQHAERRGEHEAGARDHAAGALERGDHGGLGVACCARSSRMRASRKTL